MSIVPKWRLRNNSYVYVDSFCGSDALGDGTQTNPYQTLGKAWRGHKTLYPNIICRGYFSEDMADGKHNKTIAADYPGAATFDGQGKYTIYGFAVPNMRIVNCPPGSAATSVASASPLLAGVGRAYHPDLVGHASGASGVAASSVNTWACGLYMGTLGGNANIANVSHWKPKANSAYPLRLGGAQNATVRHLTIYDVPKERVTAEPYNQMWESSLFAKVAILANQTVRFANCFFTSDCEWVNGAETFTPTGDDNAARLASLNTWLASVNSRVTVADDCIISALTSDEVFNDAEKGDITLRLDCLEVRFGSNDYYGCYPPALSVKVLSDSTGQPGSWDERTATGLISVANDKILVADDTESSATSGEILSKVLILDPSAQSVAGIFAQYASQASQGVLLGNDFGTVRQYASTEDLPIGRYRVRGGDVVYADTYVCEGDVIPVTAANTHFTVSEDSDPTKTRLTSIADCNAIDHIWLRACPTAYAMIKASDGLQAGGTYVNTQGKPVTYRGRIIAPNESFMAENSTDTFSCADDADYMLAVVFDDTRVPSQPWIPAQLWGEYFAAKAGSVHQEDADGQPIGSGTYEAWLPSNMGGYENILTARTRAQAKYIQLRITANREQA